MSRSTTGFCRVCGDQSHRSRDCPNLESEGEQLQHLQSALEMDVESQRSWEDPVGRMSNASMRSFLPVERTTPKRQPKAQARAMGSGQIITPPSKAEQYRIDQDEMEEIQIDQLTPQEMAKIAKARARAAKSKAKREETKALTGQRADYPTLSNAYSEEVAMNMVWCFRSKMMTFLWKKLLWQLRVKKAVESTMQGARWKRNPRWLAMLLGKEVAFWWGHLGALRQRMHAPVAWPLM